MRQRSALAFGILLAAASTAPAQLQFAQTTVDAGTVYSGVSLSRKFEFVNAGKQAVEILDGKASCGCLKPRWAKEPIPPGGKGTIEVDINTLSQPPGPTAWGIRLSYRESNGPVQEAFLQLNVKLVCEVSAYPAALQLFTT